MSLPHNLTPHYPERVASDDNLVKAQPQLKWQRFQGQKSLAPVFLLRSLESDVLLSSWPGIHILGD